VSKKANAADISASVTSTPPLLFLGTAVKSYAVGRRLDDEEAILMTSNKEA
jgi:hypothetical protein